jgi:hypothetical protein
MLDFSSISDDQLLELIKACMAEATKRGTAMAYAANDIFLDAAEKARIEAEAIARAQESAKERERQEIEEQAYRKTQQQIEQQKRKQEERKTAEEWSQKMAIIKVLLDWGVQEKFNLQVWTNGADKRVYFQGVAGRHDWEFCLYATGNQYHSPGEMTYSESKNLIPGGKLQTIMESKEDLSDWNRLKAFLSLIAKGWQSLKVSSNNYNSEVAPNQKNYHKYAEALQLEVANV